MDARVPTETQPSDAKPLSHRETLLIVIGVMLPVFMGSLDQTILASALPTIGRELGDAHILPWLITAYLLASTAVMPLYGKVADIHGRRVTLLIALVTHIASSLICAFAPNMLVLIVGRTLQGIGGGGLASIGSIVLGDIAAPKDRGRYYGYFAVTYTTAGALGPALGGFLADHLHWSAIFWLNIPLGLIALGVTSFLRRLPRHERPHRLDLLGSILIVVSSVSFMLALNLAGVRFAWTSTPIVALLAAFIGFGGVFVLRMLTAPEPLIPVAILRDPVIRCAVAANAFGWGSIVGMNIFLPIFLQTGIGMSPTNAGLSLIIFMVSLNVSAGLSGQVLGRVDRYKVLPLFGLILAIGAVMALAWFAEDLGPWSFELLLTAIGLGFGPLPSLTQVALQNSVPRHRLGISVGTMNFCRHLLSTILVALFGAIVLAGSGALETGSAASVKDALVQNTPQGVAAFSRVFFAVAASLAVAFLAVVLLEEKPLQGDTPQAPE